MNKVRVTVAVATVLRAFLDGGNDSRYGYELMQVTGFQSGKLYPILDRLEKAGWLEAEFENINPAAAGRPRRRWYRLVGEAVAAARYELAVLHGQLSPAPSLRTAPRLGREAS